MVRTLGEQRGSEVDGPSSPRTISVVTDAATIPTCDECGFDAARWSDDDLERTLAHTDDLIAFVVDHAGAGLLDRLPTHRPDPSDDEVAAAHRLMHHLDELSAARAALEPFEPMTGTIESVHASSGGVPKAAVSHAMVDVTGIVGDGQSNRRHHGRPWQALCLWSADRVDELATEGHPITPGGVGENLLIRGIDWSRIRGGLRIEIGSVRALTSSPAAPCHKIGDCFTDRHWDRIAHGERPGWARWYASVLQGGPIRPGDTVTVRS